MKLMIASDIHGSALYCRKLIEAYSAEKADRLLLLGDILYHGPRNNLPGEYEPKEVIAMLNEMKSDIMCVRGNCDTEVDQMVLDFPIMADYAVIPVGKRIIFATHGHNYNTSNVPSVKKGDILLHGHTHIPKCEEFGDGLLYLNPGSVSIPKNNSAHSYMIFENNLFEWKDLDGNTYMSYNL
ncbi:MAG: phosphodiesterase [Oscillospiraceae bacterium]|nr:phosphodiesterase [Oscillospiraceae bacterium]